MNVNKIQRLSKQHKLLKDFHEVCNHNDVGLTAKKMAHTYGNIELDYATTKSIIGDIRAAVLRRIEELEKEIRKAATTL